MYVNRKEEEEEETEQQLQSYQFTQGYITRHRLQDHHLTLTFIIHYQYIMSIVYIKIMNCSTSIKMIQLIKGMRRLAHIKKNDRSRQEIVGAYIVRT